MLVYICTHYTPEQCGPEQAETSKGKKGKGGQNNGLQGELFRIVRYIHLIKSYPVGDVICLYCVT